MKKEISYIFMKKPEIEKEQFLLSYIENLEEKIKRLNHENKDTIHINVYYRGTSYDIDTQIKWDFDEGDYAYIADGSKEPTKVEIIGHKILNSGGGNHFILTDTIYNPETKEIEERIEGTLYKTKKKAIDAYYNYHYGQLYQQSPAYKNKKEREEL